MGMGMESMFFHALRWLCVMECLIKFSCGELICLWDRTNRIVCHYCSLIFLNTEACVGGEVRLFGGRNQYEGIVEYCLPDSNQWRTVCETNNHQWTDLRAMLACNATGLEGVVDGKCIRPRV